MKLIIPLVLLIFALYQHFKFKKRRMAITEALDLHYDMYDLLLNLLDDPTMTELKWKKWLPIFEAADRRCEKLDPEAATLRGKVSEKVRKIIQ